MLRDGRYIRETPPKIGVYYTPAAAPQVDSPEERFVQDILLGARDEEHPYLSKVLSFILRV
jgi:hypothetical protein